MYQLEIAITIAAALIGLMLYKSLVARVVVCEGQVALLYDRGQYRRTLIPGAYRLWRNRHAWNVIDVREVTMVVSGQEVITADHVQLKVSLAVTYRIVDPAAAMHLVQSYYQDLYTKAQLALRTVASKRNVDDLLNQRAEIGDELLSAVQPEAGRIGLEVQAIAVRDLMFPGELKRAFAEVVKAQKEGQAALEKARGESAALRNLANAARLIQDNPALMNLRLLQSMTAGGAAGNTFVVGVPGLMPAPKTNGQA